MSTTDVAIEYGATAHRPLSDPPSCCDSVLFSKEKLRVWVDLVYGHSRGWFVQRRYSRGSAAESTGTLFAAEAVEFYRRQIQLHLGEGYVVINRYVAPWAPTERMWEQLDVELIEACDVLESAKAIEDHQSLRQRMHRDSDW